MKIKIKNFNGELPDYLTAGKVYDVFFNHEITMIKTDDDHIAYIDINSCKYLNGGSWEVVDEN